MTKSADYDGYGPGSRKWTDAPELGLFVAALAIYAVFIATAGLGRDALGYGTETDFIGAFVPEAERLLRGEPLNSTFHPPLYAFLLAAAHSVAGDWAGAGFLLSHVSGAVALFAAFDVFRGLLGRGCGIGAALGCLSAPTFWVYSISATSDMPFVALFFIALSLSLRASRSTGSLAAFAAGAAILLCPLLRTNGVVALLFLALPLFAPPITAQPWRQRLRTLATMAAGSGFVLAALLIFAAATDATLLPKGNVDNLALTYFAEGPDRLSGDARAQVAGRFSGVVDLFLHDPARILRIYVKDLVVLAAALPDLLRFPNAYLFAPGLIWLLFARTDRLAGAVMVCLAAQILLINLKQYEARYYLFLLPLLGAGVVASITLVVRSIDADSLFRQGRRVALIGLSALALMGVADSLRVSRDRGATMGGEVSALIRAGAPDQVGSGGAVMARKPHLSFYAGATNFRFPLVETLEDLRAAIEEIEHEGPLFLLFGATEARTRASLGDLTRPEAAPDWLDAVLSGTGWTLYRVDRTR